MSIYTMNLD